MLTEGDDPVAAVDQLLGLEAEVLELRGEAGEEGADGLGTVDMAGIAEDRGWRVPVDVGAHPAEHGGDVTPAEGGVQVADGGHVGCGHGFLLDWIGTGSLPAPFATPVARDHSHPNGGWVTSPRHETGK